MSNSFEHADVFWIHCDWSEAIHANCRFHRKNNILITLEVRVWIAFKFLDNSASTLEFVEARVCELRKRLVGKDWQIQDACKGNQQGEPANVQDDKCKSQTIFPGTFSDLAWDDCPSDV
ncbi:hypothetical protein Mal48_22380 [Thalassoglobus polymorphus]|uniref:Uncharacterized protein n=1 Tax=Thalassoglobus polymorphus TaxID=2527994 RepID=A0A517QN45_9PLAN|nr:hypothetical protein Mal48_22380 [Thalassoglobus polymorphus]